MNLCDLRRINFNNVLLLKKQEDIDEYCYSKYVKAGADHKICGYCIKCEEAHCNKLKNGELLSLVTYGTHTVDYMQYLNDPPIRDTSWHNEGVMFLFENPGKPWEKYGGLDDSKGMYRKCDQLPYSKKPMINSWPWIGWNDKKSISDFEYPKCFKQKNYGALICSLILLFKLSNAYVTNAIKCGTDNGKNTREYELTTIQMCTDSILKAEIEVLQPKIIFAFGKRTTNIVKRLLQKYSWQNIKLVYLPHPGSRVSNEKLKKTYSIDVLASLCDCGIINKDSSEFNELNELFKLS